MGGGATLAGMQDGKAAFDRALGKRIREARDRVGVKQEQLAQAVRLSRTSITNIERGRQGVQAFLLARIAEVLGTPAGDLLPDPAPGPSIPETVLDREASRRAGPERVLEWMERVLKQPKEDDDHAA